MNTLTVTIKRSKNVHAWSNLYIGQNIQVIKTDELGYEKGYKVIFADNSDILKTPAKIWIAGILHFEDATVVN
jgi:hypothetical protein